MPAQTLLEQSNAQKAEANKFFGTARYSQAIGEYGKALSSCPNYLEYEIAVLKSNISACHLKLEDWKAAIESANAALDALGRLQPTSAADNKESSEADGGVVEIGGEGEDADQELARLEMSDQRRQDIRRIRAKALMRRARAKSEEGGWGNLQGAEEGVHCNKLSLRSNLTDLVVARLQRACKHVRPTATGPKSRTTSIVSFACTHQRSEGKGAGRYDGKTKRGMSSQ